MRLEQNQTIIHLPHSKPANLQTDLLADVARRQDSVYLNALSVDCALIATGCVLDAVDAVVRINLSP